MNGGLIMHRALCLLAIAGLALPAAAQTTSSAVAGQTGTIQPAGPRTGVNGDRFLNVEGLVNGTFASYGVARWDTTAIRAAFDSAYGAGNWEITGIELEMTQDNAAFSAAGAVAVYLTSDDTTDIKTAASPLRHPFFDTVGAPDMPLGNGGNPVLAYSFNVVGTGTLDRYTQTGSLQNGVPWLPSEALELAPDLVNKLTTSDALTLVFVDADPLVAATYRGQEAFQGRVGPNLFVTAVQSGPALCYANCDGSTTAPILNVNDFVCFQTMYAAGSTGANCDNSTTEPVLNVNDFICFQSAYAAGCP
jgi:hypothetical protein